MKLYNCRVADNYGNRKIIVRQGRNLALLRSSLERDGYILLFANPIKKEDYRHFYVVRGRIKSNDVVVFLRQFSVMIKASFSISDALNILRKQRWRPAFRRVLDGVYYNVQSGVLLSDAFALFPKVFPKFMISMTSIAEVSGSLDSVMISLASYYEKNRKIKRKARSALIYPLILFILIIVDTLFIMLFVLPNFKDTIDQLGGNVPKLTKVVMGISQFIVNKFAYIVLGISLLFCVCFFISRTKKGRYALDWFKLHVPFIRTIERNIITTRFSKAFIILLESGMIITDCMKNLQKMLGNGVFEKYFGRAIEDVKEGESLAVATDKIKLFPPMLIEMLKVGEKSGNIEEVLRATGDFFDENLETSVSKATAVIEPVMIIILGLVVGVVILSVLLPMINLMKSI